MTVPFKLDVLVSLCDLLKLVNFNYGAETFSMADFIDADGQTVERVIRGRAKFGDGDPLPMLSVLEDPRSEDMQMSDPGVGGSVNQWRLLIMGFASNDKRQPLDPAYYFADAVETALLAHRETSRRNLMGFGHKAPCVTEMTIGELIVRPPTPEISDTAFFALRVGLTLVRPPVT